MWGQSATSKKKDSLTLNHFKLKTQLGYIRLKKYHKTNPLRKTLKSENSQNSI